MWVFETGFMIWFFEFGFFIRCGRDDKPSIVSVKLKDE